MKAISIRQPWAGLIVAGQKTIENRSWNTSYRGEIAIHASRLDADALLWCESNGIVLPPLAYFERAIIGIADLAAVVIADDRRNLYFTLPDDAQRLRIRPNLFWYNWSDFGWVLQSPRIIDPIPAKGRLGLWDFDVK